MIPSARPRPTVPTVIAALMVVTFVGLDVTPAVADPSPISVTITAPASGAAVAGTVALVAATQGAVTSATFDWSRNGGASWNPIGAAVAGAEGWSASWNTIGLSGPVVLRATASDGTQTAQATEPLTLANPPSVTATASPIWFNPQARGARGSTTVTLTASAPVTADVTVVQEATGQTAATLATGAAIAAGEASVRWDGRAAGAVVEDGAYTVEVVATDEVGDLAWGSAVVEVDTSAPTVSWRMIWPEPVRTSGEIHFGYALRDNLSPTLTVRFDVRGTLSVLHTSSGLVREPGDRTIGWLPRYANGGGALVPGAYWVRLTVNDLAGNRTTSSWRAFRVLRPVTTRVYRGFIGVGKVAALTFDDCNDPTAWGSILTTLARSRARASFFCLGGRVAEYPSLARRTAASPFTIGSHTWDHAYLPGLSAAAVRSELWRVDAAWWKVARTTPAPFFRPPYGAYDDTVLRIAGELGYARTMLWSVDPRDWTRPGVSVIVSRVLSGITPGGIVLMHTLPQTAQALPAILAGLRARGYRLVNLAQLFQFAGLHQSTPVLGPGERFARIGA